MKGHSYKDSFQEVTKRRGHTGDQEVAGSTPGRQHSFVEIDHKIRLCLPSKSVVR